jgi:hypothetical protein
LRRAVGEPHGASGKEGLASAGLMSEVMFRILAVIALMLLALPSRAEERRERIPAGCRELADRAGLPLALTHSEAARAVAYLALMSGRDPAVLRCRRAMLAR